VWVGCILRLVRWVACITPPPPPSPPLGGAAYVCIHLSILCGFRLIYYHIQLNPTRSQPTLVLIRPALNPLFPPPLCNPPSKFKWDRGLELLLMLPLMLLPAHQQQHYCCRLSTAASPRTLIFYVSVLFFSVFFWFFLFFTWCISILFRYVRRCKFTP